MTQTRIGAACRRRILVHRARRLHLLRVDAPGSNGVVVGKDAPDTFLMSKGHGYMIQAVILEDLGVLKRDLAAYCTPDRPARRAPRLRHTRNRSLDRRARPRAVDGDGHGVRGKRSNRIGNVYTVLCDGEVQEGSTWEATLMASSLKVRNLVAFIDNNDMQSLGFTACHPSNLLSGGRQIRGLRLGMRRSRTVMTRSAIYNAVTTRRGDRPLMVNCKTTKGRGVSYMENVPMWHYRSPNKAEYEQAVREIDEAPNEEHILRRHSTSAPSPIRRSISSSPTFRPPDRWRNSRSTRRRASSMSASPSRS